MAKKRAARTERRAEERTHAKATRQLIRDREKLAVLSEGGTPDRPIEVPSASVIELRVESLPCPQCAGALKITSHKAAEGVRVLEVRCQQCGVGRKVYVRVAVDAPN